ncbi:EpsG family protein [Streptococcus marmotae]|uniref:EpsG family protein n=1 Tax=Streptococcus marmotae TaxID=1825069 RepID=UPI00082A9535|nr:EpsG family protein [Streptococcus marmotae]
MVFYSLIMLLMLPVSLYKGQQVPSKLQIGLKLFFFYCLAVFRTLEIGNDTHTYYNLFTFISGSSDSSISALSGRYEIGYLWLNQTIASLTNNFWVFLAIVTAIIYYAYYKFIDRYSLNPAFSVFLFFILGFWGQTVNILRVQLALAMTIFAFLAFRDKKIWQTVFFMILAVSFQRIAAVFILSFLVPPKINKRLYSFMFISALAVWLFLPQILSIAALVVPYFRTYLTSSHYVVGDVKLAAIFGAIVRFVFLAFCLYIFKVHEKELSEKERTALIYQINMIFISFLITLISLRFNLLDRCQTFNWLFIIVLIPNTLNRIKNWKNKVLSFVAILIFCIAQFFVFNIYRPNWNHTYPYKTILLEGR